ncbi:XdhC family protein [Pseudomonas sp. UFMG81]|uniref:XdhC family protein n=1 Tax=Pseudomonas sp. UFMG81 TaxID=2745936 RepID=UPI0018908281|nr:XdhC family protein [Pseudomonas sp. UFMG81]
MESIDLLVLRTAHDWLKAGHRVLLATVARTWGSSPRPVGSMMALRGDGRVVGSVSGGCIEDDLIQRYTRAHGGAEMPDGTPQVLSYGISADEAHRFGLPCGGTLELVLEFNPGARMLRSLLEQLDSGQLVRRQLALHDGTVSLRAATAPEPFGFDGLHLSNTLGPGYRMLLIGAGALAEYLATMALFNGFKVAVCDPRPEHLATWSVAGVEHLPGMPDDVVRAFQADLRSCIIAVSHDPRLDDLALLEAGESEASLERLRGPIGIYIGSKTPAEIAVSVMAEVLAVKNAVALPGAVDVSEAKRDRDRGAPVA